VFVVRDLCHCYRTPSGEATALVKIDLDVRPGRLTAIAGPSGSGKSTLLRLLGLVERPTGGRIQLNGRHTARLRDRERRALRRRVQLIFQEPAHNLFGYLTVAENLLTAAHLAGAPGPDLGMLGRLGLPGTADWAIPALSGGQQQRLALLTALAARAQVVLADEPTSQLDENSAEPVVRTLRDLVDLGVTVVVASHDEAVLAVADDVVRVLDGRVVAGGPPVEGASGDDPPVERFEVDEPW
jgi:putative ABC transport system ATP-binding protein/macrolide transport system ATP-binding/permease protein